MIFIERLQNAASTMWFDMGLKIVIERVEAFFSLKREYILEVTGI